MSSSREAFAYNLKKARLKMGLSQVALANLISYTGKAISKWESGIALPPADILPALAGALDTDLNSLFDFREKPSFFLGIDGGGTKTRFMLTDERGKVLNTLTLSASNPTSIGVENTVEIFKNGIKQVLGEIPFGKVSVYSGVAGCGLKKNRDLVIKAFENFRFSKFKVSGDAENIISAALGKEDGIITILGTGSITYAVINGEHHRIGGYGHLIGDVFSGAELGRSVIEAALSDVDTSGEHTIMTEALRVRTGCDPFTLLPDVYNHGKDFMASFAGIVFEAAAKGDKVALDIINKNAVKLAHQISSALKLFPQEKNSVPVYFAGGITHFYEQFFGILKQNIDNLNLGKLAVLECEPVIGAVLLAGAPCVIKGEDENA